MSDTPETDAVIKNVGDGPYIAYLVHFARKLERERDEARRECSEAQDGWSKALNERDQARMEIKEVKRSAIEVLKVIPSPECSFFGHSKRDMHSALEPCPVAERLNAKIDKLRALLKEEE